MVQTFTIVFTCGTNDPVKVHAGVVAGFAQRKIGNKVNFVLMAEGGNIADDKALRARSRASASPITTLLDDEVMMDKDNVVDRVKVLRRCPRHHDRHHGREAQLRHQGRDRRRADDGRLRQVPHLLSSNTLLFES